MTTAYYEVFDRLREIPPPWWMDGYKIKHKEIKDSFGKSAEIFVALAYHEAETRFCNGYGDLKQICFDLNLRQDVAEKFYQSSLGVIQHDDLDFEIKRFCRNCLIHLLGKRHVNPRL